MSSIKTQRQIPSAVDFSLSTLISNHYLIIIFIVIRLKVKKCLGYIVTFSIRITTTFYNLKFMGFRSYHHSQELIINNTTNVRD